MNRTPVGLTVTGRHLTSPMTGVERTIDEPSIRFPTRAFERLASSHTDLDALEFVLDLLSGSADPSTIKGPTGGLHRGGRTMFDAESVRRKGASGSRQERTPDHRAAGDPRLLTSRGPAVPPDDPFGRNASRNGSPWREPASGTDASPSDPSAATLEANDTAPTRSATGIDGRRDPTRGSRKGLDETRADGSDRTTPEKPTREETMQRSRPLVGDTSTSQKDDFESGHQRAAEPSEQRQPTPRGALGDLVRRARSQQYRHLTPHSSADAASTMNSAPYLPVETTHGEPPRASSGGNTLNTHLIEAFEFAMDELVLREAERHGLEGEL